MNLEGRPKCVFEDWTKTASHSSLDPKVMILIHVFFHIEWSAFVIELEFSLNASCQCIDLTAVHLARQTLLQACSSHRWNLCKGEVNTAFLQGSKAAESSRNIDCEPFPVTQTKLGLQGITGCEGRKAVSTVRVPHRAPGGSA